MRYFLPFILFVSYVTSHLAAQQPDSQIVIFWHYYADERADTWQTLVDQFNATNPDGIMVTVQYYPAYSHQHEAILSALVNGGLPDVALVRNYDAALYQLSDSLVDLTGAVDDADFYPAFWQQDSYNGQQLGIPFTRNTLALYVNMDALRDLGYEDPPTTRAELGDMICAFYESKRLNGLDVPLDAGFYLAQADFQAFDFSGLLPVITDVQTWMRPGCAMLRLESQAMLQNRFASGQTLFYVDSSGARPYVEAAVGEYFAEPFTLAVVPLPGEGRTVANWTGSSLSIFHSTPERETAALAWIRWLIQPEQVAQWTAMDSAFPARRDVDAPTYTAFQNADWYIEPHFPGYDLVRDEVMFAIRGIFAGEDSTARLQALSETANAIHSAFVLQ